MSHQIQKFIDRVEKARQARSREIRLSMDEATGLVSELAQLLLQGNQLLEKLADRADRPADTKIKVEMDGGKF